MFAKVEETLDDRLPCGSVGDVFGFFYQLGLYREHNRGVTDEGLKDVFRRFQCVIVASKLRLLIDGWFKISGIGS